MPTGQRKLKHFICMGYYQGSKEIQRLMICYLVAGCFILLLWVKINGGLIPWFLYPSDEPSGLRKISSLVDSFPETGGDGSQIVWAHGTNTRDAILNAMKDPKVMMIEGEVMLKGQYTAKQQLLPVMVNKDEEDLTFDDWLSLALEAQRGLKVDFKTVESVELCLQKLANRKDLIQKPVQLGANILPTRSASTGTFSDYAPVDADRFLRLTTNYYPEATLVLGWTINQNRQFRYEWSNVLEMYELLKHKHVQQSVSISIHAMLCRESIPAVRWLAEMLPATVTVISGHDDQVNPNDFLFMRNKFPNNRVYYDMHHSATATQETERSEQLAAKLQILEHTRFHTEQWRTMETGKGDRVFATSEAVVLQKGLMMFREDPYVFTNEPMVIKGRVTLFDMPSEGHLRADLGLTISLHQPVDAKPNRNKGIHCFFGLDGLIKLSTVMKRGDEMIPRAEQTNSGENTGCFTFELSEHVDDKVTVSVEYALDCSSMSYFQKFPSTKQSLELNVNGISFKDKYVTVSSSNLYGYTAIDVLRVN